MLLPPAGHKIIIMITGKVTFSDHCGIYSCVIAVQVLLSGYSQVTCNSFAKDFKAGGGGNGHIARHYLLKDIPIALTIMILNHHIKLSRRLITETIVKINCPLYCAPGSCPSFDTFINLQFLNLNEITFFKIYIRLI